MNPPFVIHSSIVSPSHRFSREAFQALMNGATYLFIEEIGESHAVVGVRNLGCATRDHFIASAHKQISGLLVGLSASTFGHFLWGRSKRVSFPEYLLFDPTHGDRFGPLRDTTPFPIPHKDVVELTRADVERAVLILHALAKEQDFPLVDEYVKGLFHAGYSFYDVDFSREAFANFYRGLEALVTRKILKVRKLTNEFKQMRDALRTIGCDEDVVEKFRGPYAIRCEQVMHAQKEQGDITWEQVALIKGHLDLAIHKVYEHQSRKYIASLRTDR